MSRWLHGALGIATLATVGAGSVMAVRLAGGDPEPAALAAGWALAAVNAVAAWALNCWAMAGPAHHFVRRVAIAIAVRLPLLAGGLVALLALTSLQSQSILLAFFGGYFGAMVWEVALLHRMAT